MTRMVEIENKSFKDHILAMEQKMGCTIDYEHTGFGTELEFFITKTGSVFATGNLHNGDLVNIVYKDYVPMDFNKELEKLVVKLR